jgi:hypothetical protein
MGNIQKPNIPKCTIKIILKLLKISSRHRGVSQGCGSNICIILCIAI